MQPLHRSVSGVRGCIVSGTRLLAVSAVQLDISQMPFIPDTALAFGHPVEQFGDLERLVGDDAAELSGQAFLVF
jgi:hypothetical protein